MCCVVLFTFPSKSFTKTFICSALYSHIFDCAFTNSKQKLFLKILFANIYTFIFTTQIFSQLFFKNIHKSRLKFLFFDSNLC